jgi:hypothetical protein
MSKLRSLDDNTSFALLPAYNNVCECIGDFYSNRSTSVLVHIEMRGSNFLEHYCSLSTWISLLASLLITSPFRRQTQRQKFITGIFEWYEASISCFEKYLGWWDQYGVETDLIVNQCHFDEVKLRGNDAVWNPDITAGSPTWNRIHYSLMGRRRVIHVCKVLVH